MGVLDGKVAIVTGTSRGVASASLTNYCGRGPSSSAAHAQRWRLSPASTLRRVGRHAATK